MLSWGGYRDDGAGRSAWKHICRRAARLPVEARYICIPGLSVVQESHQTPLLARSLTEQSKGPAPCSVRSSDFDAACPKHALCTPASTPCVIWPHVIEHLAEVWICSQIVESMVVFEAPWFRGSRRPPHGQVDLAEIESHRVRVGLGRHVIMVHHLDEVVDMTSEQC